MGDDGNDHANPYSGYNNYCRLDRHISIRAQLQEQFHGEINEEMDNREW